MNIQISKETVELINKDFNGELFLTYRQYTFNCMCGGGPGEFVTFDQDAFKDHSYQSYSIQEILIHIDEQFKTKDNCILLNVNEKNEITVEGFILFDKTKLYNLG